jgi:hypothetical protein
VDVAVEEVVVSGSTCALRSSTVNSEKLFKVLLFSESSHKPPRGNTGRGSQTNWSTIIDSVGSIA